jgi:hypothetical protein
MRWESFGHPERPFFFEVAPLDAVDIRLTLKLPDHRGGLPGPHRR